MSMTIKNRKFGKKSEAHIDEMTFKQAVDDFMSLAPEGGWSDYWSMQQDWEFYKDNLCREGTITSRQANDVWLNPCTPETFDRWQKRNGLTRRPRAWDETKKSEEVINNLTSPEAKKIYADVHKNHWKKPKFAELMDRCVADEDCGDLIDYLMGVYGTDIRDTLSEDDELLRLGFTLVDDWREEHGTNESRKKSEASKFGAGMSPIKDLSKLRNFGEVLDVLEEHRKHLQAKAEDLKQSKDDLEASIKKLQEFSKNVDMLKQQSIKGIKDAISFNKSPEVKAAADIEQALKDALKVVYSDYANIPDVMQLLTVLDSRYATRGDKVVTAWMDNAKRAIEVDAQTIKDSIADGLMDADDVVQLVTVTRATYGVKDKFAQEKLAPVLERMNAMLATAPKLEEAIIDPKQFKELRDLIEQIVDEASAPTAVVRTKISTLSKSDIASLPKAGESLVSEGLLDKLKEMVSILKDKISALWDSFTSLFFGLEDDALDASETFGEVEETFAVVGIVVESYTARKRVTLGKKFEVLTKSVLTCCDNLVKDAALAGEFDDEVIYAEDAVKNAVESFKQLGEACVTLKNALSYHKNEDNMNVIGILADAITQIVADDEGGSADGGETDSEEDEDSVIDQVEQEYSPEGGEEGGGEELTSDGEPGEAPNPAGMPEPEL